MFGDFNLSGTPKLLDSKDVKTCVPLRLYGDGANAQQHFEINTVLPVLACGHSTLDTRLLCSVRNTQKTTVKARTDILVVLAWSFEALRVSTAQYVFSPEKVGCTMYLLFGLQV